MKPKPGGFDGGLAFQGLQSFLEVWGEEFSAPSSSLCPTPRMLLGVPTILAWKGAGRVGKELFVVPGISEVSKGRGWSCCPGSGSTSSPSLNSVLASLGRRGGKGKAGLSWSAADDRHGFGDRHSLRDKSCFNGTRTSPAGTSSHPGKTRVKTPALDARRDFSL